MTISLLQPGQDHKQYCNSLCLPSQFSGLFQRCVESFPSFLARRFLELSQVSSGGKDVEREGNTIRRPTLYSSCLSSWPSIFRHVLAAFFSVLVLARPQYAEIDRTVIFASPNPRLFRSPSTILLAPPLSPLPFSMLASCKLARNASRQIALNQLKRSF